MSAFRAGYVVAPVLGALWTMTVAACCAVALAFWTGAGATPGFLPAALAGAAAGLAYVARPSLFAARRGKAALAAAIVAAISLLRLGQPLGIPISESFGPHAAALAVLAWAAAWPICAILKDCTWHDRDRHVFEHSVIRFLVSFGYVAFTAMVAIPFYVMVMTSLKSQQALLANPLDFGLDLAKGWDLFRSYEELFQQFNFGRYLLISFIVSIATVAITLLFSVPGAYAVARLRFRGRATLSRSILLIYMVPMIVLALPIYIAFSVTGLRNSIIGILLIYPVTTIPVALYMLQGYFRGLPVEVEEAGLMDGLLRLGVIIKITLPLSLPALASVSLYVFMIAWNEFLLAFMLLDDPSIFTLTRGVAMLNSSEIPRQHLMAGAVIATVPIMLIFLGLERFMTRGLTAGAVKG